MRIVCVPKSVTAGIAGLMIGFGLIVSAPVQAASYSSVSLKSCGSFGQQGAVRVFKGTPARLGFCCSGQVRRGNFRAPILAVNTKRGAYFIRPVACYKS